MKKRLFFIFSTLALPSSSWAFSPPVVQISPFSAPMGQTIAREKPTLLLYFSPRCPYSLKVLDYLSQIHRTIPMRNLQHDQKGREDLKKAGGKMQVPCLVIDGNALYESEAIIYWLSQNRQILDRD